MNYIEETNSRLIGKTIKKADIDGGGIELTFDDGEVFVYEATDGGYSSWEFLKSDNQ